MRANTRRHASEDCCDPAMVEVLRGQAPGARLATLDAIWRSAVVLVRCGVKAQHPDWTEAMVTLETARRMAGHHGSSLRS